MSILQAIILGIVQGLTEFIPVSSTAHLILVEKVLGWNFDPDLNFAFNVLVQLGTTVAVIIYFWKDLGGIVTAVGHGLAERKPFATSESALGWLIVVATIPAVIIGLLFKKQFAALEERPALVAAVLIVASLLLFAGERIGRRTRPLTSVNLLDAIVIGAAQAVALIPGVSRSGATISGALARDLERPAAARFSFLMSVPVLVGAGVLAFRDLLKVPNYGSLLPALLVGFVVAGIVGFI
ncbi:MAG TPA: undecaprenyl-diphosphate phosphatase, partial [Candidatus Eremiobacteraceae bacterium]|nr:undecaprenyl-diphosphate phosphatase [Candidatus Eremiobacteraceae bacterium]